MNMSPDFSLIGQIKCDKNSKTEVFLHQILLPDTALRVMFGLMYKTGKIRLICK